MKKDKKVKRIKTLIERLESGADVSRKDLSRVLSLNQMINMDNEWRKEKEGRTSKPSEIEKYEKMLGVALRKYGTYEKYQNRSEYKNSQALYYECERLFEKILEYAQELVTHSPSYCLWFDRDVHGRSLDATDLPRVVTSRSAENQSPENASLFKRTKRELKLEALIGELNALVPQQIDYKDETKFLRAKKRMHKSYDFSDWK